jgi:hypothetical protein
MNEDVLCSQQVENAEAVVSAHGPGRILPPSEYSGASSVPRFGPILLSLDSLWRAFRRLSVMGRQRELFSPSHASETLHHRWMERADLIVSFLWPGLVLPPSISLQRPFHSYCYGRRRVVVSLCCSVKEFLFRFAIRERAIRILIRSARRTEYGVSVVRDGTEYRYGAQGTGLGGCSTSVPKFREQLPTDSTE